MSDSSKANGQLWIDKNSPYRLKYIANDNVYTVNVLLDYFIESSDFTIDNNNKLYAGTVLAFNQGHIRKAIFPDDIDNVIGVVGNTVDSNSSSVSVLKSGIITIKSSEVSNVMVGVDSFSDIWNTAGMRGAPVYWYLGKEEKEVVEGTESYSYSYENSDHGKVSLITPTGRRWKRIVNNDNPLENTFNVSYDNLPLIGYVDKIKNVEGTSYDIDIYLNVNKFDTTLEWSWPFNGNPVFESTEDKIVIRHGLFPKSFKDFSPGSDNSTQSYLFRQRNFVNIVALNKEDNDNEYVVSANVQNYYGQTDNEEPDPDPRTEIFIGQENLTNYRFRITGTVNLKFSRGLNS